MTYLPDESQIGGTAISAFFTIIMNPYMNIVVTATIGAAVGFIVTTILRYVWEKIKERWLKK
jgi:hypothetical protein